MRVLALLGALLLEAAFAAAALGSNIPLCTAADEQGEPQIVSDGAGGAIVAWHDARTLGVRDIYVQHILSYGVVDPAWPLNGRALCTALGTQRNPQLVADGSGGAIVVWEDFRNGSHSDLYAHHVLASGVVDPAWPVNGRLVCGTSFFQLRARIVTDGAGGAIVTWDDSVDGVEDNDVYAHRILASGALAPGWPFSGRAVGAVFNSEQKNPETIADGSGGAIIVWDDNRAGSTTDVYAHHVLSSGVVDAGWPVNGRALTLAALNQNFPRLVSDGEGGAIVAWDDYRSGTGTSDIYAQLVLADGTLDSDNWPANGLSVAIGINMQTSPHLVSDDDGGAIISWDDYRSGLCEVRAMHVWDYAERDEDWPSSGRILSNAAQTEEANHLVTDGEGGAVVVWQDSRSGTDSDVYAHHVALDGDLDSQWPTDGRAISIASQDQLAPRAIATPLGAIVCWTDHRNGNADIYADAQTAGFVGVGDIPAAGRLDFALPEPNPAAGATTLQFGLTRPGAVRLAIYDVSGRLVRELVNGTREPGPHTVPWDLRDGSGGVVPAGVYLARLHAEGTARTQRVAVLSVGP